MRARSVVAVAALVSVIGAPAVFAADGAAIYSANCAKCHGDSGKADTTMAKAMKVPAIAGDAKLQKMSESDIAGVIKGNAKHPPTVKGLSDADVSAVAGFVKQLAGK